jgi:CheY-like chemotaxis protein
MERILLVDDDRDHLALFTMVLQGAGYFVEAFGDPVAALSKFKPNSYDLVIADYRMPELNGFELYKRIREMEQEIKALLITATHEEIIDNDGEQLQNGSNVSIIRKPVSNEDLLKEINSMLNYTPGR